MSDTSATAKDALTQYHCAERLKLDIMLIAHEYITISSLKKEEKLGAKRMLIMITESLSSDAKAAATSLGVTEFDTASNILDEVIKLAESNQFGLATEKAGEAMVPITTVASRAWEVLHQHGLL